MPNTNITLTDIDKAPESLPAPATDIDNPKIAILLQRVGALSDECDALKEERRTLKESLSELKQNKNTAEALDKLIAPYAQRTFYFMVGYCSFVGIMLYCSSLHGSDIHIDPEVLKILVGSTAVTVIGLVGMILTGVFVGARKS